MNPLFNRKPFVAGLVEVISVAISRDQLDDAETVLRAVRVLRPKLAQLDTFEAWIAIKRGQWQHAIQILNDLDANVPDWTLGKALKAYCQFAVGDSSWSISANDVLENNPGSAAAGLVKLLMGQSTDTDEDAAPAAPPPDFSQYDPRTSRHTSYLRA